MKYSDPEAVERLRTLARECASQVAKVTNANVSQAAKDAAADYEAAIGETLAEDESLRTTLAELDRKAFLLNPDGVAQLRRSIVADHRARSKDADQRAAAALDTLKAALRSDALPKVSTDPAQVSLARQELSVAVGSATGEELVGSLMNLADSGSSDALAVMLNSSFGSTLLTARGVTGKRAAEALADLRTVAANAAAGRGDSDAAALIGIENELTPARSAAQSALAATVDEAVGVDAGAAR